MKLFFFPFIVISVATAAKGEIRISLNSDRLRWHVHNKNYSINIPAKVPGGIYSDLQNAGHISENLFYRFNDLDYRWVAWENWTYETNFRLSPECRNKTVVNLVFHGMDTAANIRLNKQIIATVQNMFVRYVVPVKEYIVEGNNTLEVDFKSPITESKKLFQNHSYMVPPTCVPTHYNGECHVNFLRKMQASFAWDWGPAFPSVGIWKSVEIEAFDTAVLRDITTSVEDFNNTVWRISTTTYFDTAGVDIGDYTLSGQMSCKSRVVSYTKFHRDNKMVAMLHFMVDKNDVDLWWPNGFGKQPLYHLNITFSSKRNSEISKKDIQIGIRSVELVQRKIDPTSDSLTFYFRVNGLAIFAKGSNWIPSHILPELSYDEKRISHLLLSAREAHMNILRVWGGGLYESDLFYRIADKLGIMIWQDMMFACAMYPTNQDFINNVGIEIEQQIRRLQHHPSIILWAGNNENEAALRGNWYGTDENFERYKLDYIKLYVETIRYIVEINDNTRSFVVSSPSNGLMSEYDGYIAKDPYSPFYGDTHFYNYILDSWDPNTYPNTRFASEYGFQSLPSIKTMSEVSLPSDRKIGSQFSAKRQHLLAGYVLITLLIKWRLPLSKNDDDEEDYKTFIYYSQISQAMGVKTETEKYRRDRNKLTKKNEGKTMGAMYWQLNDVWQAPSWSSIDFRGRWKMLHYYAKNFFSPIIISPVLTVDNHLNIFIISDLTNDIYEACMNISIYSWDSFYPKKVISSNEVIRKSRCKLHAKYELFALLNDAGCNITNCFIYFTLISSEVNLSTSNIFFPISLSKVINLQPANITVQQLNQVNSEIIIELHTDRIAPFVWLETDEEGQFSDNGFIFLRQTMTLTFSNRNETISMENFKKSLTVRSLLR